ncbi:MAG: hypothetical protein SFV52_07945 [Saprospiraceae bacterium]|nr:hypothetical protein [Saprospiraceae bacterium]
MKKSATPWLDKLHKAQPPVVKEGPENWNDRYGGARMLIANAALVDTKVRTLSRGRLWTMSELREALAVDFGADYTCPLTTGIFLRIIAEAAEEARAMGRPSETPWWRVVGDGGLLNPKLPGGGYLQAEKLQEEGFVIEPKGKSGVRVVLPNR